MRKLKTMIIAFSAAMFLSATAFAGTYPVSHLGLRPLGMGGAFVAVSDDYNAFFYNPAPLVYSKKGGFNLLQVAVNTNQDTIDFASWFIDNFERLGEGDLSTWQKTDLDHLSNAKVKVNIDVHSFAFLIPNLFGLCSFGTGAFADVRTNIALDSGVFIPSAKFDIFLDLMVPISIAKEFSDLDLGGGKLAAGTTIKIINRRSLSENRNALEFTDLDPTELLNKAQESLWGFGFDLGFSYTLPSIDSIVAFAIQDLYTSIGGTSVNSSWDIGYAFKPGWNFAVFSDIIAALDINSINDGEITFFNKIHAGLETRFIGFMLLRGGIYQGYPGFGFGLDFAFLKLDYANHGAELGRFPGQIEERNHSFALTIGLGL